MKRANWILGAAAVLILSPALYLVSLGQVFGLHCQGAISMQAYNRYAAPFHLVAPADTASATRCSGTSTSGSDQRRGTNR